MDDVTKQLLLTQISLAKQQLTALETFITAITAPVVARPVTPQKDMRTVSDKIDEEIGAMFAAIKPHVLTDDDGDKDDDA